MSTIVNVILAAALLMLCVWGAVMLFRIRKQKQMVAAFYADRAYCEACLSLYRAFAGIRHDFANYVQAVQMPQILQDAAGREQTKGQRKAIRELIAQWTDEKAAFMEMSDRQTWN